MQTNERQMVAEREIGEGLVPITADLLTIIKDSMTLLRGFAPFEGAPAERFQAILEQWDAVELKLEALGGSSVQRPMVH